MAGREFFGPALTAGALLGLMLLFAQARAATGAGVSVVSDRTPGPAGRHGLAKLAAALRAKGVEMERAASLDKAGGKAVIVAGLGSGPGPAAKLHRELGVAAPKGFETLRVHRFSRSGKRGLLVSGGDDRGLMYALLDVAKRIEWSADAADPLREVKDVAEAPDVVERALSKYTMHRATFESFFHDPKYWQRYLDLLAESRFNTFVLIFGYENGGYFAPPYPYFFDVDGHDGVKVVGYTPARQRKNLESLNRIIRMTHERGLNFTIAIWDHIYRGGVQGPTEHARKPTEGLVWGVTPDNLVPYTKAALAKFLKLVPDIDAIQFRMHGESGLKRGEMQTFWPDIYRIVMRARPGMRFDARAKNFPDNLIDKAVEMGLPIRMTTKYWCEQMGLPFHPTRIPKQNQHDRRHGYADLLRYPRRYKIHWRLWNGGTNRMLLWGDPQYVRRFAAGTHLYDGEGYEVNEPLATKMQDHPHGDEPFDLLGEKYRYYDWEFERYWHFFQLFGRLGYNGQTPPELWRREFERRFGKAAAPHVERGLEAASRILPRITACVFPYHHFPTTRGWAALQPRGASLAEYAKAGVGDTQLFHTVREEADLRWKGEASPKVAASRTAAWFARTAEEVLEAASKAEDRAGRTPSKEFDSTMVDLRILAHLARYHAARIEAAIHYRLFERTKGLFLLDAAIRRETQAVGAWGEIVKAAGDVYHGDLRFGRRGSGLSGHWRSVLPKLKKSLADLEKRREEFRPDGRVALRVVSLPPGRLPPGRHSTIHATAWGTKDVSRVVLKCRIADGKLLSRQMRRGKPWCYSAELPVPDEETAKGLEYFIEATDVDGRKAYFPADGKTVTAAVTADDAAPVVRHTPITTAQPGRPLKVAADVTDPSGVRWVRLRYRIVNQTKDYETLAMKPTGQAGRYEAVVPAGHVDPQWDFMYFIEVMDDRGNGAMWPDFEKRTPYVIVKLQRQP
jgi:hypothetical protein